MIAGMGSRLRACFFFVRKKNLMSFKNFRKGFNSIFESLLSPFVLSLCHSLLYFFYPLKWLVDWTKRSEHHSFISMFNISIWIQEWLCQYVCVCVYVPTLNAIALSFWRLMHSWASYIELYFLLYMACAALFFLFIFLSFTSIPVLHPPLLKWTSNVSFNVQFRGKTVDMTFDSLLISSIFHLTHVHFMASETGLNH